MNGGSKDGSPPRSAASTYSSAVAGATRCMEWIVSVFIPYLRPPILEIGIGHGSYQALLGRYGDYTGIDLDRLAGHRRRYSRDEMAQRIATAGLTPLVLRYLNSVGGLGWRANRGLRHDSLDAASVNRQIVLFDRYVLPLFRLLDLLAHRWFGQSLIAVAHK